jgi:hypothetical protein
MMMMKSFRNSAKLLPASEKERNAVHSDFEIPRSEAEIFSPIVKTKLVKLIGEKCIVTCYLDNVPTQALLDTGAQVSFISGQFLQSQLLWTHWRCACDYFEVFRHFTKNFHVVELGHFSSMYCFNRRHVFCVISCSDIIQTLQLLWTHWRYACGCLEFRKMYWTSSFVQSPRGSGLE